jgi:hypothetical protein
VVEDRTNAGSLDVLTLRDEFAEAGLYAAAA